MASTKKSNTAEEGEKSVVKLGYYWGVAEPAGTIERGDMKKTWFEGRGGE